MRILARTAFILATLSAASAVQAQDPSDTDSGSFAVIGTVPVLCSGGTINGDGTFDFGVLVDTSTGFLLTDLEAPAQTMSGAFCSARSTITIAATPMAAQNYLATPPAGFARTVDYTATATGWTPVAASVDTAGTNTANATQERDDAFTGDIVVTVTNLSTTGGATLRPVADSDYRGTVTVTLAAQS